MSRTRFALFLFLLGLMLAVPALGQWDNQQVQAASSALGNKDVLDMLKAGLTQEIVIAKIKSSACDFDTSPTALNELKAANVPDAVILAMVQAAPSQPTVKQILDKYVQAVGGEATIRRFASFIFEWHI